VDEILAVQEDFHEMCRLIGEELARQTVELAVALQAQLLRPPAVPLEPGVSCTTRQEFAAVEDTEVGQILTSVLPRYVTKVTPQEG
jgi:hypothetical protein